MRNITVVKLDNAVAFDAGEIFNPAWTTRINGFKALRFMDWMRTNHSTQSEWANRPKVGDVNYSKRGVPVEIMLALANHLNIDPWFNMPHLADDAYLKTFATLVRDTLNPDLQAYVEFSNEVWNWQFAQTQWADEQARARWHTKGAWVQYYGLRAAETAQIWSGVYGDEADARLINLISTQTGWLGLEKQILEAPLWKDHPMPAKSFDAYAIAGYFGRVLGTDDRTDLVKTWIKDSRNTAILQATEQGLTGAAHDAYVQAHQYDTANALAGQDMLDGSVSGDASGSLAQYFNKTLPYHAGVAQEHGLDLIMYEGGTHVVGIGEVANDEDLTEFYTQLNYSDEMGTLYIHLISGWHKAGGKLFNAFSDVMRPSKWGSWGALRYLSDDNPRWDALMQFQ